MLILTRLQNEENLSLQTHPAAAAAAAAFAEFCVRHDISQPSDKIIRNLYTFLYQDVEQALTFTFRRKTLNGVLSLAKSSRAPRPTVKTRSNSRTWRRRASSAAAHRSRSTSCPSSSGRRCSSPPRGCGRQ